jgi:hypothetical protein
LSKAVHSSISTSIASIFHRLEQKYGLLKEDFHYRLSLQLDQNSEGLGIPKGILENILKAYPLLRNNSFPLLHLAFMFLIARLSTISLDIHFILTKSKSTSLHSPFTTILFFLKTISLEIAGAATKKFLRS